ncbi:MAG: sodium:solute symporter family protein [Planctomycetota bacterium]|nr:MAG: sodium:solute symporter family protein [Planctomycetota bacterium]
MTALAVIATYLGLLLLLGGLSAAWSRGTSRDYMLASHTIGPVLLLMSLFGTTMTAFALVGSTGEAFKAGIGVYGLMASSSGIVHSLCFFLIGVKLWDLGRRHGYTTQIQYFRERLESNRIGWLLFPILVGLIVPYLLIGVLAAGATINGITQGAFAEWHWFAAAGYGVPPWLGSLVVCAVVLIYVFIGGMRGTAWANTLQTAVFMILGIVTFVVVVRRIGHRDTLWENIRAATALVARRHPEKLTREGMPQAVFAGYMLIPLSAGMFPHLFQHWLTARDARTFRLPVVVHPLFIMIVWAPCVMLGVWATSATVDGTPGGELLIPPDTHPNQVLALLVAKLSGELLSGLLTAGILAAIMSSLDSQFLCLGTMFTNDIVLHHWGRERFTERQIVWLARAFIVAIVALTYALSCFEPRRVFTLGIWCFSGFAGLVPLVLACLYWPRLTKPGAYASVLALAASWLALFRASDWAADPQYTFAGTLPVVTMCIVSTAALVLVSLLTRPPSGRTLQKFFPDRKSN